MNTEHMPDLRSVHGYSPHKCGYCKKENAFASTGMSVKKMTTQDYQVLMDRGWRRCGEYYYKVNLETSCCKPFTIRMNVNNYVMRKSHQKALNKFNKFLNGEITLEDLKKKEEQKGEKIDEEKKTENPKKQPLGDKIEELAMINKYCLDKIAEIAPVLSEALQILNGALEVKSEGINKFKVVQPKKNEEVYSSNFLNLIYAENRKKFPELKLPDFIAKIKEKVLDVCKPIIPSNYGVEIKENGYFFFSFRDELKMQEEKPEKKSKNDQKPVNQDQTKMEEIKTQKEKPKVDKDNKKPKADSQKMIEETKTPAADPNKKKIKFEIKLAKASCDDATFEMYKNYCREIHGSQKESKDGYKDFLCLQALDYGEIESEDKSRKLKLGCYHMKYYFDGKLAAIGVVDFTSKALSSVYFFYDPIYKPLKLGVIGAIKEIQFIKDLSTKFPEFQYYYLRYYIQDCQKMVYKAEYEPAELLCPITYHWVPFDETLKIHIDKNHNDVRISKFLKEPVTCIEDMNFEGINLEAFVKKHVKLFLQGQFITINDLAGNWKTIFVKAFKDLCAGLGKKLSSEFIFHA